MPIVKCIEKPIIPRECEALLYTGENFEELKAFCPSACVKMRTIRKAVGVTPIQQRGVVITAGISRYPMWLTANHYVVKLNSIFSVYTAEAFEKHFTIQTDEVKDEGEPKNGE